jgi:hypothetical protein
MLKVTVILVLATTLTSLGFGAMLGERSLTIAQAQTTMGGADALKGMRNKPTQQVFFGKPKLNPIPPSPPEERNTWTKNLSKDWVVESRSNPSPNPQDVFRDTSDLRVLFQHEKPSVEP